MRGARPDSLKRPHSGGDGSPGGNEIVDAGAKILQHEILLGSRRAVVDFLRPPLQRQLDGEGLVDRKGDIEKVQAVDPEIVDGVTVRLDVLARDIARLRDNVGHGIEGRGHRLSLWNDWV